MEAVLDLATDISYHDAVGLVHIVGRRAVHVRAREGRAAVLRLDSVRRLANPNPVLLVVGGKARHNHRSLVGSPSGRNGEGTADSAAGGEEEDAAQRPGAVVQRHIPAGATPSARRSQGAHGWSPRRRSWRGWPAPAHSPIRPPPSTRRDPPADNDAPELVVFETDDDKLKISQSNDFFITAFFNFSMSTCYKEIK